jgi:uncharacterized iron-regulated protein
MNRIMRISHLAIFTLLLLATSSGAALAHPHILRTTDRTEVTTDELINNLASVQVIFIGELHDQIGHHEAQLSIIRALRKERRPLAIGLEMFRKDSQQVLDRWVSGNYPLGSFLKVYNDNWSMWDKYQAIFNFARLEKIPLIGLNIPRAISSKVARNGFAALPEQERQALGNVQCRVDLEYGEFIRQAMGGHGAHGSQYLHFCEAQMLWDTMMARHLFDFLKENPEYRVVVIAGSGHAWQFGIPRQLLEQMEVSYRVVLPEVDGRVTRTGATTEVTDYLWLNEGPEGWTF